MQNSSNTNHKSDVKVMLKEAFVLFAITLIAGVLLGFVHELTKDRIEEQKLLAVQKACQAVFASENSEGMNFEQVSFAPSEELRAECETNSVEIGTVYLAYAENGSQVGYVVQSTSKKGYGGSIVLYVGVKNDGTVSGVSILEIHETPGLGMEAPNVLTPQFAGRKVSRFTFTKSGAATPNEVDAISSATITTRAVTNAVNGGVAAALELLKGGASHE
ncbi:MAG: RnfABCDGE type electron transport complex subunit G [Acetatifactor sp.]